MSLSRLFPIENILWFLDLWSFLLDIKVVGVYIIVPGVCFNTTVLAREMMLNMY